MARIVIAEWEGREYDHNPKSADWYWTLGVVAVACAVAAALFANYLLAVVIIVAAIALGLHADRVPPLHQFQLTDDGILVGEEFHPFEEMLSFSVLEDMEGELPPMLSVKTESLLSPHLIIPLEGVDPDEVYAHFLARVDEAEHRPGFSDAVAAWLGF